MTMSIGNANVLPISNGWYTVVQLSVTGSATQLRILALATITPTTLKAEFVKG